MSRPNIVWVTLESTRADHTSLHDYHRDTTPFLQSLADADGGRAFDRCFAHGIWTLSSSASILTGTVPGHHDAGMGSDAIPASMPTAAERFGDAGYDTACFSTNSHVSEGSDLDRGFDRFAWLHSSTLRDVAGPRTLLKYALNIRRHSAGFTTDPAKHSTGYLVTDVVKRWLRDMGQQSDPQFLYVHYGDPHHPYYPPLAWRDRYTDEVPVDPSAAAALALDQSKNLNQHVAQGCPFTDREWGALEALYDAEIAYTDHLVASLFEAAQTHLGDTIFVVTADHGELFGEQGMLAHKVVVDDAVSHVPLVVHGSDALAAYDGPLVQHADVMRTLLEEADADTEGVQGLDLTETERKNAYVQRGGERARRNLDEFCEHNPDFDRGRYHEGTMTALRTADHKLVVGDDTQLFVPPDETTDVGDGQPEVRDRLAATLSSWADAHAQPYTTEQREGSYTPAMRSQLADMGYLE